MCELRWLFVMTVLLWPCDAFCADESDKRSEEPPTPEGAARDGGELQLPRARRTRVTIEKSTGEQAAPAESRTKPADDSARDEAATPEARREDLKTANEIPDDLGDALSMALSRNPLLRVAEAKMRAAQAEYDQVSLGVVHDVTLAFREYAQSKTLLESYQRSPVAEPQLREQRESFERAKANLVYILGIDARREARPVRLDTVRLNAAESVRVRNLARRSEPRPREASEQSISDELRAALETPIRTDFYDTPLGDALDYMMEVVASKNGSIQFVKKEKSLDAPVTLVLQKVTVQAALQAIADLTETTFVFRDYGILVLPVAGDATKYQLIDTPMIAPAPGPTLQAVPGSTAN